MSEQAKHTPGPWRANGHTVYTADAVEHWLGNRDPKPREVCRCVDNEADDITPGFAAGEDDNAPDFEDATANARLIAAAPDLLAALQRILELRAYISLEAYKAETWNAAEQARAAIAKAQGRNES